MDFHRGRRRLRTRPAWWGAARHVARSAGADARARARPAQRADAHGRARQAVRMEMPSVPTASPLAKVSAPVQSAAVPSKPPQEINRAGASDRASATRSRLADSPPAVSLSVIRGAELSILKCRGPDRRDGRENWSRRRAGDWDVLLPNSPLDNSRI